jgi:hypothetical protein
LTHLEPEIKQEDIPDILKKPATVAPTQSVSAPTTPVSPRNSTVPAPAVKQTVTQVPTTVVARNTQKETMASSPRLQTVQQTLPKPVVKKQEPKPIVAVLLLTLFLLFVVYMFPEEE